ncbi:MAG: response regulator [Roseateles sp.]
MSPTEAPHEPRFLVVDPLEGVRTYARRLMLSQGYAAESFRDCADPESALQIGREFRPDFLITDWFPKASMSGLQLYAELRRHLPGCRLALLSFEVTPAHQAQATAAGSRFLLRKPFTAEELKTTLRAALAKLAQERPDLILRLQAVAQRPRPPQRRDILAALTPPPPALRPGDAVLHEGRPDQVAHVVIRHGELIVQLKASGAMVPAAKLSRKTA